MRALLGYSGNPQIGERLICLRNYWEDFCENGEDVLVNGATGIIMNPYETVRYAPAWAKVKKHKMEEICGDFISDDGKVFKNVEMDKIMIETGEPCLDWKDAFALHKLKKVIGDIAPRQFAYGYAITCWKAQGSEWNKVLVIEEGFPYDKIEHQKFLYTACTRSSSKLVLIRD
jgi:ATP-dependent exoDNAse (exonuclease V) alpha subunit